MSTAGDVDAFIAFLRESFIEKHDRHRSGVSTLMSEKDARVMVPVYTAA